MNQLRSIRGITDPYSRRILAHVVGRDALSIFRLTPGKLKALTVGLSGRQLTTAPARGKWSIVQIIGHLADTEVVLGWRIRMAIAQSGTPLQAMDEKKWARRLKYDHRAVQVKLKMFESIRHDHIRLLTSLAPNEWKRYGIHAERGKETVERMVQMYAGHDLNHLAQIRSIRKTLLSATVK
jgi:hypothetical protein